MTNEPYVQIEDKHGAVASIYLHSNNNHTVQYRDDRGHDFFVETFDEVSIEKIEQSVMDWATGKRSLGYETVS